ncbi:MAG: pirin family protein [Bacteroidia bacterium]
MDRRKFIKRGALGAAAVAATGSVNAKSESNTVKNEKLGFNHIPSAKPETIKNNMMKAIIHRANTRGHANHGWLDTHHTFSFASYYNPERMHFGALRVLNDDRVNGGMGFGRHPHDNMEIISIPLEGALEHKDSMGNTHTIKKNDVQVMSAGTGIFHSEKNKSDNDEVRFLQIWVYPNKKNVTPRYDQIAFDPNDRLNKLQQVASPNAEDAGVWMHQDAWFYLSDLEAGKSVIHNINKSENGVYLFVLEGDVKVGEHTLGKRDGMGITQATQINIETTKGAEVLLMEVPMSI